MDKKILFIDPLCDGHEQFNLDYIKCLKLLGNVSFVCREDYSSRIDSIVNTITLDKSLYTYTNKFNYRLSRLSILIKIMNIIKKNSFDLIIFSSYETISTSIISHFLSQQVYVINHNNLDELINPVKMFFMKRMSKKVNHIVFYPYMKNALVRPKNEIYSIPLPLDIKPKPNEKRISNCDFFAPSGQQDVELINKLINILVEIDKNIYVKFQKHGTILECPNSLVKKYFDNYSALLISSKIIIAAVSFNNRASGVVLEALFQKKVVLAKKCLFTNSLRNIYPNNLYFIEDYMTDIALNKLLNKCYIDDSFSNDHCIKNVAACWSKII